MAQAGRRQPVSKVLGLLLAVLISLCLPRTVHAGSAFADARKAYLRGDHSVAVVSLRSHLNSHPRDATAWIWIGASYYQLGQHRDAAESFAHSFRLKPSGDAVLWLGAASVAAGETDRAVAAFERAARSSNRRVTLLATQWLRSLRGQQIPVLRESAGPAEYAYVVSWYNPALTNQQVDAIVRSVLYYSSVYRVDPRLVMSLIAIESGFRVTAQSPAGAYGLGQLMPATWQSLRVHPGDPVANIYGTVRVLRGQMDRFGQNPSLALAAYNAGRGTVERYGGIPPYRETQWYVFNVLSLYRHLTGS
jgi:soluble lytic murein transglycosylase-like protein